MKTTKPKKYLASEWLRTCSIEGNQACHHDGAMDWYFLRMDTPLDEDCVYVFGPNYKQAADAAESAEWSDRAIGLRPRRTSPI